SRAFSVTRLPSYSQCVHAPCFPTRRSSDLRLRVVPRGGRRARGGRRPVRRRGALGPPPRHFPPVYGPASPVRGLLHGGADLPLHDRRAALSVRLRPRLHDVSLRAPPALAAGGRGGGGRD